jgi:hypothetical protein
MIETPRRGLHRWDDRHREAFATMDANPEVIADYGRPIRRVSKRAPQRRAQTQPANTSQAVRPVAPAGTSTGSLGVATATGGTTQGC